MQIKVKPGFLVNEKTDVILFEHFEDSKLSSVEGKKINALLGGLLQKSLSKKEFTGKLKQLPPEESQKHFARNVMEERFAKGIIAATPAGDGLFFSARRSGSILF